MHTAQQAFVDYIGLFGGVLGVSIAVYLQLISKEQVPWLFVAAFLTLGMALIGITTDVILGRQIAAAARAFAYVMLIGAELYALRIVLRYVRQKTTPSNLTELMDDLA